MSKANEVINPSLNNRKKLAKRYKRLLRSTQSRKTLVQCMFTFGRNSGAGKMGNSKTGPTLY